MNDTDSPVLDTNVVAVHPVRILAAAAADAEDRDKERSLPHAPFQDFCPDHVQRIDPSDVTSDRQLNNKRRRVKEEERRGGKEEESCAFGD